MKKLTFVLMAICCLAVSCKQDTPEEKKLKEQLAASVDGSELGIDLKYELIGVQFVDTIYYGDTIKGLAADKLDKIWVEPNKEYIKAQTKYLESYLGKNDDLVKTLDSLADLTTPIEKYDSTYIYAYYAFDYLHEDNVAYILEKTHSSDYYRAKDILDNFDLIKETIAIYDEMKLHAPDEIYGYRIKHDYKIFNPLLKCEQTLSEIITVNSKLEIL